MNLIRPHLLLLPVAITAVLAACSGSTPDDTNAPKTSKNAAPAALTLDESRLPEVNRFLPTDLDTTVDVCQDLNAYVNGTWLAAHPVPGDRTSWGAFEMLDERSQAIQRQLAEQAGAHPDATGVEKIVGDIWATGMDQATIDAQGIAPLQAGLDAIAALDGQQAIANYLRTNAAKGRFSVFGFGSEADFSDSSMRIAYAFQSGLGLPDRGYYFDQDKAEKLAAYQQHVAKMLELSGIAPDDAAAQAADVVAFETRLAKVSKSSEEMSRDVSLFYNPITPAEADALTPNFPWTEFFQSQGLEVPAKFSLAIPEFHAEVSTMLAEVPASTWQSYLRYHLVDDAAPFLSDDFVQEHFAFHSQTMRGQKEIKERGKRVLDTIEDLAGEALGQMYVEVAFPAQSKAQMEELVGNLTDALKVRIENLDWMTDETKAKALEKWASFTPKIGYPDKWRDWSGLETGRDSYLDNVLAAIEFNYKWDIAKIGKPVDKTEWAMPPQMVNAYYNPLANEIVFPAAILQPPFFDPDATPEMNYGGIGAVIGHEMTHGYDDQGSRFGPTGNFENWWTEADAKGFAARTEQLVEQFNGYEAQPGKFVNGKLTLGENIADLGGLAVAYDAMQAATAGTEDPMTDGMSRDQRFFANWATVWRRNFTDEELAMRLTTDPHAPANFRAIGAPSNMPAFAQAFECKPGDAMVHDAAKRIVIW